MTELQWIIKNKILLTMIKAIIWEVMDQIWDLFSANASANYHFYEFLVCCCHSDRNHLSLKTAFLKQGKYTKWGEEESKYYLMPREPDHNRPLVVGPSKFVHVFQDIKLLIFMRLTLLLDSKSFCKWTDLSRLAVNINNNGWAHYQCYQ